jgi:hypothetical protein
MGDEIFMDIEEGKLKLTVRTFIKLVKLQTYKLI